MLQTQLDTYITRSRCSQGPLRCAQPEQGQPYKHTRLVQTELYQWFTRYPNDDTQPFHSLLRILRDPDVPTGDLSPLPYPAPKNQHERMANIQSVLCRAAQAEPAFRELWNERTACTLLFFPLFLNNGCSDHTSTSQSNSTVWPRRMSQTTKTGLRKQVCP